MDEHSIERIRNVNFSHSVRGYDRGEVDRFLDELAQWLETGGGGDAAVGEAVRLELERIGEQTAGILTEAHATAQSIREDALAQVRQQLVDANLTVEKLRGEAGDYSADARDEADAYGRRVRSEADTYADSVRNEAEAEVVEQRQAAEKEAERIVAEAGRRRNDVEAVISDLEQRRDAVLAELERLASGIAGTATEHRTPPAAEAPDDEPEADAAEDAEDDVADETDETTVLARDTE